MQMTQSILVAPNYAHCGKGRDLRKLRGKKNNGSSVCHWLLKEKRKKKKPFSLYYFFTPAELAPGNMTLADNSISAVLYNSAG